MKKTLIIFVLFLLILTGLFFYGKHWFKENSVVTPSSIEIFEGASTKQVTEILELSGSVNNANHLYWYIKGKQVLQDVMFWSDDSFEVSFKSGSFDIEAGNFDTLISTLNEYKSVKNTNSSMITFPEGITVEGVADRLSENTDISKNEFLSIANDDNFYELMRQEFSWLPKINDDVLYNLEGYLQANTYDVGATPTPQSVIKMMLSETDRWHKDHKVDIEDSKFSFQEVVTLASVVERESKFEEDRPKVSQVFINRLKSGMRLQSDITAAYANGEHKIMMTYKDIEVDSPYNTYVSDGLPPGPINSPSDSSLRAVLKPEGSDFDKIFFYARPSGETFYTNTLEQHQEIIDQYRNEWVELTE